MWGAGSGLASVGAVASLDVAVQLGTAAQFAPPVDLDEGLVRSASRVLGVGLAAAAVAAATALVYRWYTREPVPKGLTYLFALSVAALSVQTVGLFGAIVGGRGAAIFELDTVLFNLAVFGLASVGAPVGRYVGDRIATDVFAVAGVRELDAEVSRLVRSVGRVTDVTIPEAVEDIEGYDPVDPAVKAEFAGKTFLFPRRLTVAELRDRIVTRLKDDYEVGHVDLDVDDDGTVTYLAVGSRAAGLGPTLAPGSVAVAVRADPPNSASAGDVVQVWTAPTPGGEGATPPATGAERPEGPAGRSDEGAGTGEADGGTDTTPTRVATAEFRAAVGDVVTLVVDEADAARLDAEENYRLVTLPATPQADREFASLLRSAAETMGVVSVGEGSDLVGATLGTLDVTVAAVKPRDGPIRATPTRSLTLSPGDTLYVVARPDTLRQLESRAGDVVDGT